MRAILAIFALGAVSCAQVMAATPTESNVGAGAPTIPNLACTTEPSDHTNWITPAGPANLNGYERFPSEMEDCALACYAFYAVTTRTSAVYACGGFAAPPCPPNLYNRCIKDCMAHIDPPVPGTSYKFDSTKYSLTAYTPPCADCMAGLQNCTLAYCTTQCVTGSSTSACQVCANNRCNGEFRACSGLNPELAQEEYTDVLPIVLGVLGAALILLAIVVYWGCKKVKTDAAKRGLQPHELAMLAGTGSVQAMPQQQPQGYAQQQTYNPGYDQSQVQQGYQQPQYHQQQELTAYQQQYEQQQRMLATGGRGASIRPPPSARMSAMITQVGLPSFHGSKQVRLVAAYDFVGERGDELTVVAGTKLTGIEEQDSWWLAKTDAGVVGLIPSTYVEVDRSAVMSGGGAPGASQVQPDF